MSGALPARQSILLASGPAGEAELVADRLLSAGASAVSEEAIGDGRVRLTADVDRPPELPAGWQTETVEVDPATVADSWRPYARPVRVGSRVVLQPPWAERRPAAPGDLVVELDPGRAFGSGSHASTRLALAATEALVSGGERLLDVGCGSGVLCVTATMLGVREAVAFDVDPEAVRATAANATANRVSDRVRVSSGPIGEVRGSFDLVTANINRATVVALAADLVPRIRPGGHAVLAGFLRTDVEAVRAAYGALAEVDRLGEDEWAALVMRRRAALG